MVKLGFRIRKVPKLQGELQDLTNNDRLTEGFLSEVGFAVERRAKRGAPVRTGRLRASIGTTWAGHPAELDSEAKGPDDGPREPSKENTVVVGSGVGYAKAVHENHPTHAGYLSKAVAVVRAGLKDIFRASRKRRR